ncbi:MAG: 4Fe-4S dicluster domain-containing protein [Bacteroidetes bacterium]|nr:4Fe-4S dicluster domain-containing protein [Bacteroidota bacterium]
MNFKEHLITTPEPSVTTIKSSGVSTADLYKNCKHLIIRILPSHPYQYLPHQELMSLMGSDVIQNIKEKYTIGRITFIIGISRAKEYRTIVSGSSCEAKYCTPSYPFELKKVMTKIDEYQLIDWFDFIVLAKAAVNEGVKAFPISVTLFENSGKKAWLANGPLSIVSIAKQSGISPDDYIFTNHPFANSALDSESVLPGDTKIEDLRAQELLIFPKTDNKKKSVIRTFFSKFTTLDQRVAANFETSDIYQYKPCQKCLDCVSICPAGLYPFMLSAISERGSLKEAVEMQVAACTECGLCSSVCPSGIPLMHNILKLKKEL